jgi:amino acid permease
LGIWLLFYCFQKDVSGIKSAAYYGVFGIIMFLILNIINLVFLIYTEEIPDGEKNINFFTLNLDFSATSSIYCIILSFSFHTYAFSIYECLDTPDPKKMLVTSSVGIFISMLIYLLIGSIGYILYGDTITDDILTTVGFSGIGVLEYISFAVIVVTSFPLTFSALKHYFIYLIEIILTMTRDKLKEKKVKNQQLVSQNTEVSQNKDSEIVRVTNYVQKHGNDKNDQDHGIAQNQNEHDNSHDSVHLDLIHIPEFVEFILVFGLFLGIFIFARKFPNLKLVKF